MNRTFLFDVVEGAWYNRECYNPEGMSQKVHSLRSFICHVENQDKNPDLVRNSKNHANKFFFRFLQDFFSSGPHFPYFIKNEKY